MDEKPIFDQDIDEKAGEPSVPVRFIGMAAKQLKKNPFRKKGKMPYMLTKGAMYLIADAKKEEFEPYLRKFAGDLAKQYTNIPYNDATRIHYKHNFGKKGADIDAGMVLHFWTQVYKGLEFLILDLKEVDICVGFVFGKQAPVDPKELLLMAFSQVPESHEISKKFEEFAKMKPKSEGNAE